MRRPDRRLIGLVVRRGLRGAVAGGLALFILLVSLWVSVPDVRPLRRSAPDTTAFMQLREREATADGRNLRRRRQWVPYSRISPHLRRAVLVAEDDRFFQHDGIDVAQIRQSLALNLRRWRPARGGSTITQQLAKNLYLSPSRNPVRKLRELFIARRLEAELSKTRILELYLNVIEWGDGVWGAEAAARTYFGVSAAALTRDQAALLAGAIVNPRVLNPARPRGRLQRRQRLILARMGNGAPATAALRTPERREDVVAPSRTADSDELLLDSAQLEDATSQ